jgi:hypothetical protein
LKKAEAVSSSSASFIRCHALHHLDANKQGYSLDDLPQAFSLVK